MAKDTSNPAAIELSRPTVVCNQSFTSTADVLIAHNDTLDFLRTIPNESVRLVVSSPPYNIGKPYEDKIALDEYLDWQRTVLRECVRILQPNGSLCWEVGNHINSGEIFPLDFFFYQILKEELGLKLRNRMIWYFEHGLHARKRFSGRYEVVLWFTKEDSYVFNLDPVRIPQTYPGKRHYKGPNKGKLSGNPLGKNPGDIWQLVSSDWENEIWDIPNVKWNHPEKTDHPAQFPIELIERLVLALTGPGDYVLDPFMGVGSSLVAAVLHGRKALGVDNNESYCLIAKERIDSLLNGTLSRRRLGTQKFRPSGKEKISQLPEEWATQQSLPSNGLRP